MWKFTLSYFYYQPLDSTNPCKIIWCELIWVSYPRYACPSISTMTTAACPSRRRWLECQAPIQAPPPIPPSLPAMPSALLRYGCSSCKDSVNGHLCFLKNPIKWQPLFRPKLLALKAATVAHPPTAAGMDCRLDLCHYCNNNTSCLWPDSLNELVSRQPQHGLRATVAG